MKTIKLFLVFITISCRMFGDCYPVGGFIQTYKEVYKKNSAAIYVKGVRLADQHHGIRLKVLQNYSSVQLNDTINIWYCNPSQIIACEKVDFQNTYAAGDTLLYIAVPTDQQGNIVQCNTCPGNIDTLNIEQPGDYTVAECYRSVLRCIGDSVNGDIFNWVQDTTIAFTDLEQLLTGINELNSMMAGAIAYPNPTNGNVTVSLPAQFSLMFYEFVSPGGTTVFKKHFTGIAPESIVFDLEHHNDGCYLIRLVFRECIITKKIIRN